MRIQNQPSPSATAPRPQESAPARRQEAPQQSGTGFSQASSFTPAKTTLTAPAKTTLTAPQSAAVDPSQEPGVTKDSRFSGDFRSWLLSHGYGKYDFVKGDLPSFGGKDGSGDAATKEPVIFIHGNSGTAADWNNSVQYFESKGYKPSELYGMTWGDGNVLEAGNQEHSKKYETEVRAFIQAVKEYTGADKVNIVSHSMGVTLARKAVEGGKGVATDGNYNLGKPLTDSVDTFIGIAGANQGLTSCFLFPNVPTASAVDGFYPGVLTPFGVVGQSEFLQDINSKQHYEGQHVYSIWSPSDEVVNAGAPMGGGLVYGVPTNEIPGEDGEKIYPVLGHFQLKDLTADEQYKMITDHQV